MEKTTFLMCKTLHYMSMLHKIMYFCDLGFNAFSISWPELKRMMAYKSKSLLYGEAFGGVIDTREVTGLIALLELPVFAPR